MIRPTPPAPKQYRIKEFNGLFVIEKLIIQKVAHESFVERFFLGKYFNKYEYRRISQNFNSLKKAKKTLKQKMSENEVQYHYY